MTEASAEMIRLVARTNTVAQLVGFSQCGPENRHVDYAAGMVECVREWITAREGPARAFAVIQNVADGLEVPAAIACPMPALPAPKRRGPLARLVALFRRRGRRGA